MEAVLIIISVSFASAIVGCIAFLLGDDTKDYQKFINGNSNKKSYESKSENNR